MTKFFRWCTLLAGLCCVVLIPWSFFRAPHPLDFSNGENVVRVVGALFVCAALCKIGVGALRDRQAIRSIPQAGSRSANPLEYPLGKPSESFARKLGKRPLLVTAVVLLLCSLPILFQIVQAKAKGRDFNQGDWVAIIVGEFVVTIIVLIAWFRAKRMYDKYKS
jgi:hypothetical protein